MSSAIDFFSSNTQMFIQTLWWSESNLYPVVFNYWYLCKQSTANVIRPITAELTSVVSEDVCFAYITPYFGICSHFQQLQTMWPAVGKKHEKNLPTLEDNLCSSLETNIISRLLVVSLWNNGKPFGMFVPTDYGWFDRVGCSHCK